MALFTAHGSEYIIPLSHNNHLVAIIFMSGKTENKRLKEREFIFLNRISRYAAVALANSIMYQNLADLTDNLEKKVEERTAIIESQKEELEKDIQLAKTIQAALLPQKIPCLKEVDIAYKYVPMMAVGGDFIDIHYREGMKETGLFICDVSGHGVASALIASMVKMSLSSWGKYILHPGEAFIEIKQQLQDKIGSNFLTACMCTINIETGQIISANAGHPPMLILRKNGEIESVRPKGRVIISFADSKYEEAPGQLYAGDKVIMYTDGVFECRDFNGTMIDVEGLIGIIKRNRHLTPQLLSDKIYNEIFSMTGCTSNMEDDFAIIIAEYKGRN
jgi:serine phosphatase RsbU (regulator of sigma subunit)